MTSRASLEEIASCVAGYDPKALPVAQAQEFIARLVPRVRAVEKVALRSALGRVLAADVVSAIDVSALRHEREARIGHHLLAHLRSEAYPVYASPGYLAQHSTPADANDLRGHDIIGYDLTLSEVPAAISRSHWISSRVILTAAN